MKKLIIFLLMLVLSTTTFSQQSGPFPVLTKQDYLRKSKRENIAALSLLFGGFALELTAILTSFETELGANLVRAGLLANLVSIPFFIAARRNKRKAASISFKNQYVHQLTNWGLSNRTVPSVNLRINL